MDWSTDESQKMKIHPLIRNGLEDAKNNGKLDGLGEEFYKYCIKFTDGIYYKLKVGLSSAPITRATRLNVPLAKYNFTITHIPGITNVLPDALSRFNISTRTHMNQLY